MGYTKTAIEDYIKTVVVVDDQIGDRTPVAGKNAGKQLAALENYSGDVAETTPEDGKSEKTLHKKLLSTVDFSKLAKGFFDKGILCSLYKLTEFDSQKVESAHKSLVDICEIADVMVLDRWLGEKKTPFIAPILKALVARDKEKNSSSLRSVVVYSQDGVGLCDELKGIFDQEPESIVGLETAWKIDNISVIFIEKVVGQEDAVVLDVLEKLNNIHSGVLPAFALRAIAAVRMNAARLLSRFRSKLDYELIVHSLLTRRENDIKTELAELVSEDLKTILDEDERISSSEAIYEHMSNVVSGIEDPRMKDISQRLSAFLKNKKCDHDALRRGLSMHLKEADDSALASLFDKCERIDKCQNSSLSKALENCERVMLCIGRKAPVGDFATLMCCAPSFSKRKKLKSGTIVAMRLKNKNGREEESYLVCVTPSCDCRRLATEDANFLLWKLMDTPDGSGLGVSFDEGGKARNLYVHGKFCNRAQIVSIKSPAAECFFDKDGALDSTDGKIRWVSQLREMHAQRIQHFVGGSLSKVGLLENELLRRFAMCS